MNANYLEKLHIEKCHFNTSTQLPRQAIMCLEPVAELVKCGRGTILKENSTARGLWEQIYAISGSLPF